MSDEVTVTESVDTTETELVESVDTEVNARDEMDKAEFAEHYENLGEEGADTTEVDENSDEPEEIDLDELYRVQIDAKDTELDKPVLLKHDGNVMEVSNLDELRNLAERGFNATKKFQRLAEDRKALEAQLEELGQVPNVEESNDVVNEVEDVADEILSSSYAETFIADMQSMPDEVRDQLSNDPQLLRELSIDYKSGLGSKIMPKVSRAMAVGNLSFRDAYVKVGREILQTQDKQEQDKPKVAMLKAQPKKANSRVSNELGRDAIDAMSEK